MKTKTTVCGLLLGFGLKTVQSQLLRDAAHLEYVVSMSQVLCESLSKAVSRILGLCCPEYCTGNLYLPNRDGTLTLELPEDYLSVLSTCDHCGAQLTHPHGCDSTCVHMDPCIIFLSLYCY